METPFTLTGCLKPQYIPADADKVTKLWTAELPFLDAAFGTPALYTEGLTSHGSCFVSDVLVNIHVEHLADYSEGYVTFSGKPNRYGDKAGIPLPSSFKFLDTKRQKSSSGGYDYLVIKEGGSQWDPDSQIIVAFIDTKPIGRFCFKRPCTHNLLFRLLKWKDECSIGDIEFI